MERKKITLAGAAVRLLISAFLAAFLVRGLWESMRLGWNLLDYLR